METTSETQVLVVDDDFDIRDTLRELLELEGYTVQVAVNGREALDRLRNGARPGLILLDLMMPEMSGWEFRNAQLAEAPEIANIPVLVLSATPDVARSAEQLRAAGYIRKPFDLDQLLDEVQSRARPPA